MKTVSDDLFRLVKSLSKPEKGYFKKFAAKNTSGAKNASGTKQNYILLFEAIDEMESYDEELLKRKLKSESFVKQLAVYKVYLFNLILKSLHHYGAYENAESRLTEYLINIKTLIAKNLYREAMKLIKKAKVLAYQHDKMKFLFELLANERHITVLMPDKNALEDRERIYAEQLKLHEQIGNFYQYSWLCDQMTILVDNEAALKSKKTTERIEKIMASDAMSSDDKPMGYYARMNYNHTHLVYNGSKNNNEQIFRYLEKGIEHAEANRHFIDENPQNYVYDLINYLLYCSYEKRHKEADETLAKIKATRQKFKDKIPAETEIQIFYHASNVEMIIYERTGDMKRGRLKAKQVEKDIERYKKSIPHSIKSTLITNLVCFYFIDEDYTESLKHVNTILNDNVLNIRNDVQEFVKLFQLLVHYELGNYDLLEYLTQSVSKFFKGRTPAKSQEQTLLNFFGRVIKVSKEEHRELFDELLFTLQKYPAVLPTEFFDYIAWAEAKANGKALVEVKKEKY